MTLNAHLQKLEEQHHMLEEMLEKEEKRSYHNKLEIMRLKKKKLLIKDEIGRLEKTA